MKDEYTSTHPVRIRLHDLADPLKQRMKAEGEKNRSRIIRRAIRAYLDNNSTENMKEELSQEIRKLRADFTRVGGNLNQLALYFNVNDTVSHSKLAKTHEKLQAQFEKLTDLLLVVKGATEKE